MKCNCIDDIEKQVAEQEFKGKKILSAKLKGVAFIIKPKTEVITSNEIEVEVEGMKKKQSITMVHTYCPFCGTKTKDDEA